MQTKCESEWTISLFIKIVTNRADEAAIPGAVVRDSAVTRVDDYSSVRKATLKSLGAICVPVIWRSLANFSNNHISIRFYFARGRQNFWLGLIITLRQNGLGFFSFTNYFIRYVDAGYYAANRLFQWGSFGTP